MVEHAVHNSAHRIGSATIGVRMNCDSAFAPTYRDDSETKRMSSNCAYKPAVVTYATGESDWGSKQDHDK